MVATAAASSQVSQNQFLQLMVKQLQSQDPLSPTDNGQMLAQLAQFSTLSGMESLNTSFSDMLSLQEITQGSNLIGKQVTYNNSDNTSATGTVKSVGIVDGKISLQMDSGTVNLSQVVGIAPGATSA